MKGDIQRQKITKKDAAKDDFFGIDEQRSSAHWGLHVLACVVCVIFAIWVWLLNPEDHLCPDQINIVTLQLAEEYPENFARDPIFSGNAAHFYPYLYRVIIKKFIDKFGLVGGHRILQFPLTIGYLVVMYFVLYALTRSVPASLIVTLFSSLWRDSMGASYWGMDRLQTVQPRSFVLVLLPLLLVMAWKYRQSWWFLVVFGVLGLLMNISPPGALFFAIPLWIATLGEGRLTKQKLQLLAGAIAALIIGAGPFIYSHITARTEAVAALSPQERQLFMEALQFRFSRMSSFPEPLGTVGTVILSFSPVLLLATAGWALRGQNRGPFDRWLLIFFLFTMIGFVVLQYVMQEISASLDEAPPIANIHRGQKNAYLPLYIYAAVFLRYLFGQLGRPERRILIAVAGVLVAVMPLVEFSRGKGNSGKRWENNVNDFSELMRGEKIETIGWRVIPVAQWARQNTPVDSLFLFGRYKEFRIYALRSIVGVSTDGGIAMYNGPRKMIQWYKTEKALEQITAHYDAKGFAKLAKETGSDYIVLPAYVPAVPGWKPVYKDNYWTVYAPLQG